MLSFKQFYLNESEDKEQLFLLRTKKHIDLVKKYCKKIYDIDPIKFKGIIERGNKHDASKFLEPERTPYIDITWYYKNKHEGKNIPYTEDMHKASHHHVTTNSHHPEFYNNKNTELLNKADRDALPKNPVNATKMSDLDIGEMIADWAAMSEELGTNTAKQWADSVIDKRWIFTKEQKELIYDIINKIT